MKSAAALDPGTEAFLSAVGQRLDLGFSLQRYAAAEPAIRERIRHSRGCPQAFLTALSADSDLLQDTIEAVVVPETHFFRHPGHFAFLRDKILPSMADRKGPIRIWSAGCSTGEEPYSLAILLHQLGLAEKAQIFATDVCRSAVEKGKKALYRSWSLRGLEEWPGASRYFRKLASGQYRLAHEATRLVQFQELNLTRPDGAPLAPSVGMDVIFCRNVLIYMADSAADLIVQRLLDALAPGGWLIPGPADLIGHRAVGLAEVTPYGVFYHRRPQAQQNPASPTFAHATRLPVAVDHRQAPPEYPWRDGDGANSNALAGAQKRQDPTITPANPHCPSNNTVASGPAARPQATQRVWPRDERSSAGRRKEASRLAQAPLDAGCLSPRAHYEAALARWGNGDVAGALACLSRTIYLAPECPVAYQVRGLVLIQQGQTELARRAFRSAYLLATRLPPRMTVELSDGETAEQLARAARLQLRHLQQRGGRA